MKFGKRGKLVILFLLANLNLFAQKELRKVVKDTLFFNYDHSFLKKSESDSEMVYIEENKENSNATLHFEIEELRTFKLGKILDIKKFFHRPEFYNKEYSSYKNQKLYDRFSANEIIFVDTANCLEMKVFRAIVILRVE